MNQAFFELHDLFDNTLVESRDQQTNDERVLQTQFFSRIAFVSTQIKDLDFATHRRIIEHGLKIGNTAAECIIEADTTLETLANESGQELMEISSIARKDFMRIPNEFVHPQIDRTERISKGLLSEVMTTLSSGNIVTGAEEMLTALEAQRVALAESLYLIRSDIDEEISTMRRQMNYVKAEVFPILEYSLRYFRRGTELIIDNLQFCN